MLVTTQWPLERAAHLTSLVWVFYGGLESLMELSALCHTSCGIRKFHSAVCRQRVENTEIMTTTWWRHEMETFSALLAIFAGSSPATGEFPAQRPVTQSFDVFCDLRLNKRLNKQSWALRFEKPSRPLWRHSNGHYRGRFSLTQSFDAFFDLRLNIRLSKQSWGWWLEMPLGPLWLVLLLRSILTYS